MKIMFAYLPIENVAGYFCISQQRFSKVRGDPELIYPMVPASTITLLKNTGYEVAYIDAILERMCVDDFLLQLGLSKPDLIIFETKTPIVKENWRVCKIIKKKFPGTKLAVCGDHVSVLPEETMQNSPVDYVIRGGDFDFSTLRLVEHITKKSPIPKGIYYRENGQIKNTSDYELINDLDSLPFIDREIIPWHRYHEAWRLKNKFFYLMASRGCPYSCTFCSWPQMLYKGKVRYRKVEKVVEELRMLIERHGAEEIFFDDDTFTCNKTWVRKFCETIIENKIKILWSCNGRVDNVDFEMLSLMKAAGCRLIKFGIESASQVTLDKIKKGYTIEQIKNAFKDSKKVGILTHGTVMLGYPWETRKDIMDTIEFVKTLNVDQAQFSIPITYPGTELFEEAKKNGWLRFPEGEWEKYDMSAPTLTNKEMSSDELLALCASAWKTVYFSPRFLLNRLSKIRGLNDIKLAFRGLRTVLKGHLFFLKNKNKTDGC
jgi:radical SAM superfamily enzyme YgiQ (UPF0313 family)